MKIVTISIMAFSLMLSGTLLANETKYLKSIIPGSSGTLTSIYKNEAPIIDGKIDKIWAEANPLDVKVVRVLEPNIGAASTVIIRSI